MTRSALSHILALAYGLEEAIRDDHEILDDVLPEFFLMDLLTFQQLIKEKLDK